MSNVIIAIIICSIVWLTLCAVVAALSYALGGNHARRLSQFSPHELEFARRCHVSFEVARVVLPLVKPSKIHALTKDDVETMFEQVEQTKKRARLAALVRKEVLLHDSPSVSADSA